MPTDVRTSELVINKLSKQQYENIPNPDPNQLYLVPEDEEHKPICYPTTASEVNTTSMLVKSSIDGNGRILTENGFVYNTSGNPTISDTKVICELNNGQFETKLTGLTGNTQYHIRSYAINSSGLNYGDELVQSTLLNPIPSTYQLVEYLESSGTQYIDTGYKPNIQHTISFDISIMTYSLINTYFGCANNNSSYWVQLVYNFNTNKIIIYYGNTSQSNIQLNPDFNFHQYKFSATGIFIDNYFLHTNNNFSPNINFYLFTRNSYGATTHPGVAKCSKFIVIDENNQYVKRMYPVYRKSDSKPGMYDIVNGVFYTNQGTGEFTVGPDAQWTGE